MNSPLPPNSFRTGPDEKGLFGIYGGRFVAETLMPLILQLEQAYKDAKADPSFQAELDYFLEHYVGRPSPLYYAERLTEHLKGAKIYMKRDELNHTGAHKINNVMGQILLARRMGKKRIIAEMVWQRQPPARALALNASSIWARSILNGRSPMSSA
jgi:tryptophan synthase beta chain